MTKAEKNVVARAKSPKAGAAEAEPVDVAMPRRKAWSRFFEGRRLELDEIEAFLITLLEEALQPSRRIERTLHIKRQFEISNARWIALIPLINSNKFIRPKGLAITSAQMKGARTVADIAARLLAGSGKYPTLSESRTKKGRRPPQNFVENFSAGRDLEILGDTASADGLEAFDVPPRVASSGGQTAGSSATTELPSSNEPSATPSFFFELEGEGVARGDQVLWGKEFDLVFNYGVLSRLGLAVVKGEQLAKLVQDNTRATLGIDVAPKGLDLIKGGAGSVATFENGAMIGPPPRFRLRAPEKADAEPAPRGVRVIFTVAGAMIYSFFLEIQLVDKLTKGRRATPVIDLNLAEVAAVKVDLTRVAKLVCISQAGSWQIYGNINGIELIPKNTTLVSPAGLDQAYRDGTLAEFTAIAGDAIWRNIDGNLEGDADDKDAALASMKATVAAGSKLYQLLSADPVFKKALELIEGLPEGSRITVYSDGTAFPWELLYPLQYVDEYPPENYQPERFWGRRFLIESLLIASTEDEKPPARARQPGSLRVSMGFNSGIDTEPPWNTPGRPLLPVRLQTEYFDTALKATGGYFDQYDPIFDTLRTAYVSSLIYYFCHGSANQLKFHGSKSVFKPMHIMGGSYPGWPVVFLNACDAADISPLSFFSFRTRFRGKKAAGLIAPSFPVPTLFAAVFAKAFLSAYAKREPVGAILFRLRRELLAKNNPLGLWYSLQCPLDVKAPEG